MGPWKALVSLGFKKMKFTSEISSRATLMGKESENGTTVTSTKATTLMGFKTVMVFF